MTVALVAALAICATIAGAQEAGTREPGAFAYVLGVAIAAPVLVSGRWPLAALVVSAGLGMIAPLMQRKLSV